MTGQDRVLIDIKTCGLTISGLMAEIARHQAEMPDCEVFMDGDRYAIVARPMEGSA